MRIQCATYLKLHQGALIFLLGEQLSSFRGFFSSVKEWIILFYAKHKEMNAYPHFVETDVGVGRQL